MNSLTCLFSQMINFKSKQTNKTKTCSPSPKDEKKKNPLTIVNSFISRSWFYWLFSLTLTFENFEVLSKSFIWTDLKKYTPFSVDLFFFLYLNTDDGEKQTWLVYKLMQSHLRCCKMDCSQYRVFYYFFSLSFSKFSFFDNVESVIRNGKM